MQSYINCKWAKESGLHQRSQRTQRETKMQSEKMSVVMGGGFTAQWVHEPAYSVKTKKSVLCAVCALCDLWYGHCPLRSLV